MNPYKFLQSRNHFKKGEIHELSDVVAALYKSEGVVVPVSASIPVEVKELKAPIQTKEEKVAVETMTTKSKKKVKR